MKHHQFPTTPPAFPASYMVVASLVRMPTTGNYGWTMGEELHPTEDDAMFAVIDQMDVWGNDLLDVRATAVTGPRNDNATDRVMALVVARWLAAHDLGDLVPSIIEKYAPETIEGKAERTDREEHRLGWEQV